SARVFRTKGQEQDVARQTLRNLSEMMRRVDDSPEAKKDAALSHLRKNDPPIFMGSTDPSEAGRWLEHIEQLLDLSSTSGELRLEFATNCLREKA
ncbi:hypothetical protein KK467_28780, partial [Klebsiella pneumoniae]|uniref:hypothetical protein n=1 Tax=Klebsiella pneumoniae TaxID=573 RepID=UPI001BE11B57